MWKALLVDLIVHVRSVLAKGHPSNGINCQQPGLDDLQVLIEIVMCCMTLVLRAISILGGGSLFLCFLHHLWH